MPKLWQAFYLISMDSRLSFYEICKICILQDIEDKNFCAFIPWAFVVCISLGFYVSGFFCYATDKNNLLILFSALLAAQGILLGMSVNAIQHIIENVSTPGFSSFLREKKILYVYMFFIHVFQSVGVVALAMFVATCILIIVDATSLILYIATSLSIGFFVYSLKQTLDTSILLRDLVYYRSIFDELS